MNNSPELEADNRPFDIDAYYQEVSALISTPQERLLHNDDRIKTSIVLRSMFEKAHADIKIFCGKFSVFRTEFQKNLINSYPTIAEKELLAPFKEAVEKFLEKGHRIIAIIENPAEWEQEKENKGYFVELFQKYAKQIELRTTDNYFNQLMRMSHFYISPTISTFEGAIRWEVDETNYKAIVSPSQKLYKTYNKAFEKLSRYSYLI
ncbi:MAG: hypothetical protein LBC81_00500 [Tannerellaceae bacterium]|jgi:hypothetical protein|nr:hypothetical protein [Tannerellaceae bacterium]